MYFRGTRNLRLLRFAFPESSARERAEQTMRAGGYALTTTRLHALHWRECVSAVSAGACECVSACRKARAPQTRTRRAHAYLRTGAPTAYLRFRRRASLRQEADTYEAVIAIKIFRGLMRQSTSRGYYSVIRSTKLALIRTQCANVTQSRPCAGP